MFRGIPNALTTLRSLQIAWHKVITFLESKKVNYNSRNNVYINENPKTPLFECATGSQHILFVLQLNVEMATERSYHVGEMRSCFQYGLQHWCMWKWSKSRHLIMVTVNYSVSVKAYLIHSDFFPFHSRICFIFLELWTGNAVYK